MPRNVKHDCLGCLEIIKLRYCCNKTNSCKHVENIMVYLIVNLYAWSTINIIFTIFLCKLRNHDVKSETKTQ